MSSWVAKLGPPQTQGPDPECGLETAALLSRSAGGRALSVHGLSSRPLLASPGEKSDLFSGLFSQPCNEGG